MNNQKVNTTKKNWSAPSIEDLDSKNNEGKGGGLEGAGYGALAS